MTQTNTPASKPAGRHFLQIPGPTPVPERILRAIDRQVIDHRGPEFQALSKDVLAGIKSIFKTEQPVIIYSADAARASTDDEEVVVVGHCLILVDTTPEYP